MIISRKHRYIFLHCRKTAGSSICVSLARTLGGQDLILSALSETLNEGIALPASLAQAASQKASHLNTMGRLKARLALGGWRGQKRQDLALKKLALKHWCERLHESQPQHAYAETIARAFPEEWAAFPKFCVVRNPWTKTVSDYFWRINRLLKKSALKDAVPAATV